MAKKTDPKMLQEALKRFRLLSEYSFYTEEPKNDDNLILGNVDEADEESNDADIDFGGDANTVPPADAKPADDSKTANPEPAPQDAAAGPNATADDESGVDDMETADTNDMETADTEAPEEDEVDVDVTQLVDNTKDAKKAADVAGHKASKLMNKFSELERKIDSMASISHKIDSLEKEIAKRNPTPNEKLELRSLDSAPFNIKLKDYWKDVDGYDTGVTDKKHKEYILTKSDIDDEFLDSNVKNSFNVPDEEEDERNDYEEEDIY